MKKGIFPGDAQSIQHVFPQDVCEALSGRYGLEGRVYTRYGITMKMLETMA